MQNKLATEWMAQKLAEIGINIPTNVLSEAKTRECWNVADGFEDGHLSTIEETLTIGETAYEYLKGKFNHEPCIL